MLATEAEIKIQVHGKMTHCCTINDVNQWLIRRIVTVCAYER